MPVHLSKDESFSGSGDEKGIIVYITPTMGSCSSVQKIKSPSSRGASSSPHKEKPLNGESKVKVVASSFSLKKTSEFGSKEEMFFDSRAWLDSDWDDDFFSVNGDFTPSRGNSPNNQIILLSRAKSDKTFAFDKSPDTKSEPSPTGRKKLGDLFQETPDPNASNKKPETNGEQDSSSHQTESDQPRERANSASSSELVPCGDLKNRRKEERKAGQCCLPSLGQSFSFGERRQKMNPVNCSA